MRIGWAVAGMAAMSTGCNRYDLFRLAGYQQQSFSNRADILFVIDNSNSMMEESESLAVNFAGFISGIDEFEQQLEYEGLPDAVTNFVDYVQNRSAYIDYQFAITTTDVDGDAGKTSGPSIARGEDEVAVRFTEQLVCESACFDDYFVAPTDPDHVCGDPVGDYLSQEFLDCACGGETWRGNCGSASEEGIEAVFLAMCRAVPNPPVECFADVVANKGTPDEQLYPSRLSEADIGSNAGLLRENANFIPVIVSDEGDSSRRTDSGEDVPEEYQRLFAQFNTRMAWVSIGPALDEEMQIRCRQGANERGVYRYNYMVHASDGLAIDIYDEECDTRDFEQALEELAGLLTNLLTSFPLQSVPVPGSVEVLVDGEPVDEAEITGKDDYGIDEYSDGWTYRGTDNAIVFHGAAIPPYDAKVEVYYLPIDGMPRELPF